DESSRDALFVYARIPESASLLEVTATVMKGAIETQTQHSLTLGERGWRWQGKIEIRPVRTDTAELEVELPANWSEFRATSSDIVESVVPSRELPSGRRLMRLIFADPRRRPTTISLEATPAAPNSNDSA